MSVAQDTNTVAADMAKGWQLPAYLYSDPAVYELEQQLIFRREWIYVGLAEDVSKPGDYFTTEVAGIPLVVTRGADGAIHGLVNACLHRLHPVASGKGCSRLLQCKYHGWTYTSDGALRTAPRSNLEEDFDKSSMKLPSVRIEQFGNLLFANTSEDAPPLASTLEGAAELTRELDLDFAGWKHAGTFRYEIDANWKLFMENSLECYHCDLVHKDTFGSAFETSPEDYICRNYRNMLTQEAPMAHAPACEVRPADSLEKFRMLYIWPATAFSVDEYAGVVTRLVPLGPKRCAWIADAFEKPDADPATLASWLEMYDATFNEDKAVVTAQQAGYDSGRIARGRLLPSNESSIAMFQRRVWEALAPVLEGGQK